MIRVTDAVVLDDREVSERFVRASGPGGQNVNKVSTAVELRFNVLASSLPADVKERLIALAGTRVTADGVLLIDSRESRTQAQNRLAARGRLIELIKQALVRPRKRRKTKPGPAAREKRLTTKKIRGETKALRATAEREE
jgi:ribosome-associated protein